MPLRTGPLSCRAVLQASRITESFEHWAMAYSRGHPFVSHTLSGIAQAVRYMSCARAALRYPKPHE